jgi:2-polyprenyl-3-methyl-5-hydroxy-6-metoxy-1,4-benzoquinol methylase
MSEERAYLEELSRRMPATAVIVEAVLAIWPDHDRYMRKSIEARDPTTLRATEILAEAALKLAGGRLAELAVNYRWTCDRLREEELNFHRTGSYRLKTFEEAYREVYSDAAYMEKYVDGLLLSQILWFNHAASCAFYLSTTPQLLPAGGRMLEIGPGHGLMTYLALRDFGLESAAAWDLSPVSIEHTRAALALLGFDKVDFRVCDLMAAKPEGETFDLVVLSEVLEHMEDPKSAMRALRPFLGKSGLVFINVPINSPSPDHLYLMQTPDDARQLLTETGFAIVEERFFATQGTALDRALRNRVSVSACLFARPLN